MVQPDPQHRVAPDFTLSTMVERLYALAKEPPGWKPFGRMLLTDEPAVVKEICKHSEIFHKDYSSISSLARSRFESNGEEWNIRRNISQPCYVEAMRPHRQPEVATTYAAFLDEAQPTALGIYDALLRASLQVFNQALGAGDIPIEEATEISSGMRAITRSIQLMGLVGAMPGQKDRILAEARAFIASVERQASVSPPLRDVLARFAESGSSLEGFSAAEEYVMNMFAGVDTSVASLSWIIDRLGLYRDVQASLFEEVQSASEACPLTECFIDETLRVFPPIPLIVREVTQPISLPGADLAAGQRILISLVGLHRHPDYWSNPHKFDPRRREFLERTLNRDAFLPFATGQRICGGARIARLELTEGTKALLRRFTFERTSEPIRIDYALALRPDNWSALTVRRR